MITACGKCGHAHHEAGLCTSDTHPACDCNGVWEEHPDLVRMRKYIRDSIAQGYQHGDVNHLIQPITGMLKLRQRDGKPLTEQDLERAIERLEKACMAENALLAYLHPEKYGLD